jgi:hypothetical protein
MRLQSPPNFPLGSLVERHANNVGSAGVGIHNKPWHASGRSPVRCGQAGDWLDILGLVGESSDTFRFAEDGVVITDCREVQCGSLV